jgi:hypothetical protein
MRASRRLAVLAMLCAAVLFAAGCCCGGGGAKTSDGAKAGVSPTGDAGTVGNSCERCTGESKCEWCAGTGVSKCASCKGCTSVCPKGDGKGTINDK